MYVQLPGFNTHLKSSHLNPPEPFTKPLLTSLACPLPPSSSSPFPITNRQIESSYSKLTHTLLNTHAHLYSLSGTNPALQPILLMAHQDVVPVNPATLSQWTYPPFEGRVEGGWVWGRGSADCKNQVCDPALRYNNSGTLFKSGKYRIYVGTGADLGWGYLWIRGDRLYSYWGSCPP